MGVELVEGHFVLLFNILAVVQLLHVDLVIVLELLSVLQVLTVVLVIVLWHAVVDAVYHLLHLLETVLMRCAIYCFDVVRCPNLYLPISGCVSCHSDLILHLVRVACLVTFIIVNVSLAHL